MVEKLYVTYNDVSRPTNHQFPTLGRHGTDEPRAKQVHKLCQEAAPQILADFKPQLMIAIGGGGYVPARILRSFLKQPGSPNIPIQAIGLSLYEQLAGATDKEVEAAGTKVTRTQWLDLTALGEMANLVGKRVLIVDEVDDTRTTLEYAVKELQKDVEEAREKIGSDLKTEFAIFVLHVRFSVSLSFLFFFFVTVCSRTYANEGSDRTEQGQAEEGHPSRVDHERPVPGRPDRRRRVDLLSVGGHGHRRARQQLGRGQGEERSVSDARGNKNGGMEEVAARPCIIRINGKGRKWPLGSLVLGSWERKGYRGVWDTYSHGEVGLTFGRVC